MLKTFKELTKTEKLLTQIVSYMPTESKSVLSTYLTTEQYIGFTDSLTDINTSNQLQVNKIYDVDQLIDQPLVFALTLLYDPSNQQLLILLLTKFKEFLNMHPDFEFNISNRELDMVVYNKIQFNSTETIRILLIQERLAKCICRYQYKHKLDIIYPLLFSIILANDYGNVTLAKGLTDIHLICIKLLNLTNPNHFLHDQIDTTFKYLLRKMDEKKIDDHNMNHLHITVTSVFVMIFVYVFDHFVHVYSDERCRGISSLLVNSISQSISVEG
jgi:hypothetical protein